MAPVEHLFQASPLHPVIPSYGACGRGEHHLGGRSGYRQRLATAGLCPLSWLHRTTSPTAFEGLPLKCYPRTYFETSQSIVKWWLLTSCIDSLKVLPPSPHFFKTNLFHCCKNTCHLPFLSRQHSLIGLPRWFSGKESSCQCRRHKRCRFNPCVGKIPWRGAWQPTPVFLPGESPWTEEPSRLQSMGSQTVGHSWATKHSTAQVKV